MPAPFPELIHRLRGFLGRPRLVVGVDIGSHTTKLAVARHGKGAPSIIRLGSIPTPPGAYGSRGVEDAQALARLLKDAIANLAGSNKGVLAGTLGGPEVVIARLLVDDGTPNDIDLQVQSRAAGEVPFDPDETLYSYSVVPSTRMDGQVPVLLVGVHNPYAQTTTALLEQVGRLGVLDVDAFALHNAFSAVIPAIRGPALLAHIGHKSTTVILMDEQGQLIAARDLPHGTASIQAELERGGLSSTEALASMQRHGGLADHAGVVKEWVDGLASDIGLLWKASDLAGGNRPLFLSGGGSLLPDLVSELTEALDASGTERVDPTMSPLVDEMARAATGASGVSGPLHLLAIGLALRGDALDSEPSTRTRK